ncbi:MAG: MBL fold metallo-hydrolase [Salinivirgaceae bacterium]|nr:MBL fold metallo-hydrolase [Salinivirgaceae bacterium]
MVQICALASGSNGNCYYIGNEQEAILVDVGISNRQLTKRLFDADLSLRNIKAVFITHEHTDHIQGMRIVTEKNNIQGFATEKTYEKARKDYRSAKINYFNPGDTISIGNIKVHSFSKQHDAIDPVSFRVEIDGMNVAVLTDLGTTCENIIKHLQLCDAAFLESNYEHDILLSGRYPAFLKQRVLSDNGHLSNTQAFDLVKSLNGSPLKTIFLSHISADNNRVDLAVDTFKPLKETHRIEPTSRFGISKVVEL